MGNLLSPPPRADPINPPNGRVLECDRCKTPALVSVRCSWCFEYPEIDKKGKLRDQACRPIPISQSIIDLAAHFCQSDECKDLDYDVVAVGTCMWCWKYEPERKFD